MINNKEILEKFGAEFYTTNKTSYTTSRTQDLYHFTLYTGKKKIEIDNGDCVFYTQSNIAKVSTGPTSIESNEFAVVIRGYKPPQKKAEIGNLTTLPFINGCSTRQIFAPERIGDPTLQLLSLPPHSSEQAHHMHTTARVAKVISGTGTCVIGLEKSSYSKKLEPGTIIVIHPMCPHNFETKEDGLLVMPLHIFSSAPGSLEFNHPMFNGSHHV